MERSLLLVMMYIDKMSYFLLTLTSLYFFITIFYDSNKVKNSYRIVLNFVIIAISYYFNQKLFQRTSDVIYLLTNILFFVSSLMYTKWKKTITTLYILSTLIFLSFVSYQIIFYKQINESPIKGTLSIEIKERLGYINDTTLEENITESIIKYSMQSTENSLYYDADIRNDKLIFNELPVGNYQLRIKLDNYIDIVKNINISKNNKNGFKQEELYMTTEKSNAEYFFMNINIIDDYHLIEGASVKVNLGDGKQTEIMKTDFKGNIIGSIYFKKNSNVKFTIQYNNQEIIKIIQITSPDINIYL